MRWLFVVMISLCGTSAVARDRRTPASFRPEMVITDANPLEVPPVGAWRFRVVSPTVLELQVITTKDADHHLGVWDFVDARKNLALPQADDFLVEVAQKAVHVRAVGFRRRVRYAPLGSRDLRIDNRLFLVVDPPIPEGAEVRVANPRGSVWVGPDVVRASADPDRRSPAIHVNQVGYVPEFPKRAFVGYYLGTLGEMEPPSQRFDVVEARTGRIVFTGTLAHRQDIGFEDMVLPYRQVYEADFTSVREPGEYRVRVPGLGVSWTFRVTSGAAAAVARTYALGFYHQRCGAGNVLPFTRFTHRACHTALAEVPTSAHAGVRRHLARFQEGSDRDSQAAPVLDRLDRVLFPFVRTGRVDVSGGHHDAGDYSKYTTNSASMIHALVLAVDAFPGVGDLDNLGLPESGNGVPDLLDIARWEAAFLARMQDDDGGFYFLVYPRDRPYEDDVLPDRGDPQVVFPKNTAATAAAVAALAQAASSPAMRRAFPDEAAQWFAAARKGWTFLEQAWKRYGRRGAYQRVTHYGDTFQDKDEVAWAAMEMLLATGDAQYMDLLRSEFDPTDPRTYEYGWMRLFEGYGNAVRSCALAPRTGRPGVAGLDPDYQRRCRAELLGYAADLARFSRGHAYGVSLHTEYKRHRTAGWHFAHAYLFDLAAAEAIEPTPQRLGVMVSNLDYPLGANPNDISYVSGLGTERLRDVVSAYAKNDHRLLPPSGLPIGDLIPGFGWLPGYGPDRKDLSFPPDDDPLNPYPFYDRYGDTWNTQAEHTVVTLARSLAGTAALMARTPLVRQPWRSARARVVLDSPSPRSGRPLSMRLEVEGLDPTEASVVWDVPGHGVFTGPTLTLIPAKPGPLRIEAEAQWPDGRRVFGVRTIDVTVAPAP